MQRINEELGNSCFELFWELSKAWPPASAARDYRRTWIDVDLEGWSYLDDIGILTQEAEEALRTTEVPVTVRFDLPADYGSRGLFKGSTFGVNIYALPEKSIDLEGVDIRAVNAKLLGITTTLHHELQHLTQRILKDVVSASEGREVEAGGFPPRMARDYEWYPSGVPRSGGRRRNHALRDVEFHPKLVSLVGDLERSISRSKDVSNAQACWKQMIEEDPDDWMDCMKTETPERWREFIRRAARVFLKWKGSINPDEWAKERWIEDHRWPRLLELPDRVLFDPRTSQPLTDVPGIGSQK